ncbi:hypothetical protein E2C01_000724 [Portunus trituberculatus]|uniref:Uncharacterized protein n=1 Tax=Portunus trituberculatus TaxID=210409 RepID=A0A5B7CFX7_PORTR|nr:hypothetical protein [Portunus trituberculatus]
MADIVNSAAGSIIPLASNNTLALGLYHSIQTSSTFQGGVDGGADTGRVMYLRDPRYRSQFIAQWDEPGQSSTFMSMTSKSIFFSVDSSGMPKEEQPQLQHEASQWVMLCQETVESHFKIIEVWNVGREAGSHTIQQETWGFWTPATGLQQVTRENKYDRRKDLQGFHLRTMPYESLVQDRMLQNFREGYVVDVWHTLQEQLNFTTRLYIRRPVLEGTWTLYGQPFDMYLWVTIPVSILACAVALWLFNSVTVHLGVNQHFISANQAFWIIFSGIIQQCEFPLIT